MTAAMTAGGIPTGDEPLVLDVDGVSMHFGGLKALSEVSIRVGAGEIVGVIGPNGAGKTTLLNVMSGLLRPSKGRVVVGGRESTRSSVHKRASLGLARTFQRVTLFSDLTVGEHVQLALEASRGLWKIRGKSGVPESGTGDVEGTTFLRQVGIARLAGADVGSLPLGQARLVELAMALATRPVVLLLDEPFSGLGATERDDLADLLLELRATSGPGIVLVEHDVGIVSRLADRLVVLDFGQVIADGPTQGVLQDANVRRAYFGLEEAVG
jgi:branched-chain amino acid transport system ATP-binding protein